MTSYMLIESRDPFDSNDVANFYGLASALAKDGHDVTVFLVQNGVLPARQCGATAQLEALVKDGVTVLADDFSLAERGIKKPAGGVKATPIDAVIDAMADGAKTIWH